VPIRVVLEQKGAEDNFLWNNSMAKEQKEVVTAERTKCEVYSRIVGYIRPVQQWNNGKKEEFKNRKMFKMK
jgi:anaerobic ribonucleoside-triphosphate reductase